MDKERARLLGLRVEVHDPVTFPIYPTQMVACSEIELPKLLQVGREQVGHFPLQGRLAFRSQLCASLLEGHRTLRGYWY